MEGSMDNIFYNGVIHTLACGDVQAVAVKGGKVAAVGSNVDILALAGPHTEKHDLQGQCMVPGFNDSHCHLLLTGTMARALDLCGVRSVAEIIERGRRYIAECKIPAGKWITGYGFDHNTFREPHLPTRADADCISTQHPILLDRICGHIGTLNSAAIKAMGYDENTTFSGGMLDRDANGVLNGIVREVALDTCKLRIPMPEKEEVKEILCETMARFNACGITSVQSDDLWSTPLDTLLAAFDELVNEQRCTVRVWEEVQAARMPQLNSFLERGLRTGDGNPFFQIGNIKLITDGSLGARTAFMREPYSDAPGDCGVPVYTDESLSEIVLRAHTAGMQIAFHAIGDGALAQCIAAVEAAQAAQPRSLRHRIVHCQFGDESLYARMLAAGICADIQPPFVATDYPIVDLRVGAERAASSYAWRTLLQMGIPLGGGSDSPVETFAPLWGIYCAITRCGQNGKPSGGWHPGQCLSAEQALRLYTQGGAYLSFAEDCKGCIAVGSLADFAVLSHDLLAVPPQDIPHIQVVMTVIGGRICYRLNAR